MKEYALEAGETVESFFISISDFDRIYNGDKELVLFLWRAFRTDQTAMNPLYPDFERREIRDGKFRNPDVTIQKINNIKHIIPHAYRKRPEDLWKVKGTSLFDRNNTFEGKEWAYLEIPARIKIPNGLLIIKDDYNERFKATHYSIVPNRVMSLSTFKNLLDLLYKNIQDMKEIRANG